MKHLYNFLICISMGIFFYSFTGLNFQELKQILSERSWIEIVILFVLFFISVEYLPRLSKNFLLSLMDLTVQKKVNEQVKPEEEKLVIEYVKQFDEGARNLEVIPTPVGGKKPISKPFLTKKQIELIKTKIIDFTVQIIGIIVGYFITQIIDNYDLFKNF